MSRVMQQVCKVAGLLLCLVGAPVVAQLDDPTRPPDFATTLTPDDATEADVGWELSSILVSPQRSVAIINGTTVQVGETLAGAKVLEINLSGVVIRHRDEVISLKLLSTSVKTSPGKE